MKPKISHNRIQTIAALLATIALVSNTHAQEWLSTNQQLPYNTTTQYTVANPSFTEIAEKQESAAIIGGTEADPNEWPFIARIEVDGNHFCGGMLVDVDWVLTAAHCLEDSGTYKVILGDHQIDQTEGTEQRIDVKETWIHPDYNGNTHDHDVGLIRLNSSAQLGPAVAIVDLGGAPPVDSTATVIGWGNTAPGSGSSNTLMEVDIPVVDSDECEDSLNSSPITENMVCAGVVGNSGGCHGDSGGPLVHFDRGRWIAFGVVSWGRGFFCDNFTVFARIAPHLDWIQGHYNYWNWVDGRGTGSMKWWVIGPQDQYVSGDFDGDGYDELLAINPNGWHHTMYFDGSSWQYLEGSGNGSIKWWVIGSEDKYVAGDFNGDGRDELLAINPNGWHHTMQFDGSSWQYLEGSGNGSIKWWVIGSADKYVTGDFNNDGRDELLAINPNGWHHTMQFNGSSWQYLEGSGNGRIKWWVIGSADKYVSGDFNANGGDELLAINPNGWHHTMQFNGSSWQYLEGSGNGSIKWWGINGKDNYITGDFDADDRDELLAINNHNGWSHTMKYDGSTWQYMAGNSGYGQMGYWLYGPADKYTAGRFSDEPQDQLLNTNPNGWWHVVEYATWMPWWDRDNPGGNGDFEHLAGFDPTVCLRPTNLQAQRVSDSMGASSTGETFAYYNVDQGFACRNAHQSDNYCDDYKVRFMCR